jgi:chaperonin GroES
VYKYKKIVIYKGLNGQSAQQIIKKSESCNVYIFDFLQLLVYAGKILFFDYTRDTVVSITKEKHMFQNFRPLGDRVLIRLVEQEQKTTSGIIIPDAAKEKTQTGKVIAIGQGRIVEGKLIPLAVKAGDIVYVGKYSGTDAGEDHRIVREDDILGIIE